MKKEILVSFLVLGLGPLAQAAPGAADPSGDLVCASAGGSQQVTFIVNPRAGTVVRDGQAYSIFETPSFFGYIITPVDPIKGRVDWSFRSAVNFAAFTAGTGGVLGLSGGTLHLPFTCQRPPER